MLFTLKLPRLQRANQTALRYINSLVSERVILTIVHGADAEQGGVHVVAVKHGVLEVARLVPVAKGRMRILPR